MFRQRFATTTRLVHTVLMSARATVNICRVLFNRREQHKASSLAAEAFNINDALTITIPTRIL